MKKMRLQFIVIASFFLYNKAMKSNSKFVQYNANPMQRQTVDCVIRAISKFLDQTWERTFCELSIFGLILCDMPSANHLWSAYLKSKGYKRALISDDLPDDYCVEDFCDDHPNGTFLLAIDGHVVTVIDGRYYDSFDSGRECPIYYWFKEN